MRVSTEPGVGDCIEFVCRQAGMRGEPELECALLAEAGDGLGIVLQERPERLALREFGVSPRELLQSIECEEDLHWHRLLTPEGAVVVERGDTLCWRHVVAASLCRSGLG